MRNHGPDQDDNVQQTHDDDDRFAAPSSAQLGNSKRVIESRTPALLTAAAPVRRTFFDPWNSSSTGHQRAENRLSESTSWRTSRSLKLSEQYKNGLGGGSERVADTVGAGSENFGKDGRKENGGWEKGAKGLRTDGQKSLAEVWRTSKTGKRTDPEKKPLQAVHDLAKGQGTIPDAPQSLDNWGSLVAAKAERSAPCSASDLEAEVYDDIFQNPSAPQAKQIFSGLCFYLNGSTAPLISDHKLKHMLSAHGARHAIALGRRTVTHVILGKVSSSGGCGGGLASTKIQKEVARTSGKAVKYITVEWVLDSIKAGSRLSESRYAPLKLAQKTQRSVLGMMNRSSAARTSHG